jgi:hypothetical protein
MVTAPTTDGFAPDEPERRLPPRGAAPNVLAGRFTPATQPF